MRGLIFLLGLIIGSFLNVLIYRLPRGLGFIKGRSFCPKCKKKINWFDNVPVLSFLILRGRCRFCQSPISWQYPVVELVTGGLFVLTTQDYLGRIGELGVFGTVDVLLALILFFGLVVIFFIDLEHQIIPDEIIIPLIVIFFLRHFVPLLTSPFSLLSLFPFIVAITSFLFLYSIYAITKGKGMGFGDVKLAFMMGLILGWPKIVVAFYLAFLTGALVGIILILLKKAGLKQKIAFGPFLVLGTMVAYLSGEKIINFVKVINIINFL